MTMKIKDSGERTEFSTGAVRDLRTGKGRMDLVPLDVASILINFASEISYNTAKTGENSKDLTYHYMNEFVYHGNEENLILAMYHMILHNDIFVKEYFSTAESLDVKIEDFEKVSARNVVANAVLICSKHFENGTLKYGERNWEKGMEIHCYIDSAARHYVKMLAGFADEPHHLAALWNLMCAIWTYKNKPELNDLPCAKT